MSEIRDRILDAAVDQLRRHGLAKTGVVDVARALDMSHSNVYKHFDSKSALFDAVAKRWLDALMVPLDKIAQADGPAPERLKKWSRTLAQAKRKKVLDDPEMFAVYQQITESAHDVVAAHLVHLRENVARILADGHVQKHWRVRDAKGAAVTILNATARFHHPALVKLDAGRTDLGELDRLMDLLIAGLEAGG